MSTTWLFPAIFQDTPLQTRMEGLFLAAGIGKVFSLPGDSGGKWFMGNGSLGTCGKGLGGLHPHLSFFFICAAVAESLA